MPNKIVVTECPTCKKEMRRYNLARHMKTHSLKQFRAQNLKKRNKLAKERDIELVKLIKAHSKD
jgi:hypothetical protein